MDAKCVGAACPLVQGRDYGANWGFRAFPKALTMQDLLLAMPKIPMPVRAGNGKYKKDMGGVLD